MDEKMCKVLALGPTAMTEDRIIDDPLAPEYDSQNQQVFIGCSTPEQCPGSFECGEGYSGPACAVCSTGYFRLMSFCYACPVGELSILSMLMTIVLCAAVVGIWVLLNYLTCGSNDALDIGLLYMQIVSIVQSFAISWPEELSHVTTSFSVVNFDVDFITPSCFGFEWRYPMSFTLQLLIPVIVAAKFLLQYGLAILSLKLHLKTEEKLDSDGLPVKSWNWRSWMLSNPDELRSYRNELAGKGIPFLIIVYNGLCMKVFETFQCTTLSSGRKIISVAPETTCEYSDGTYGSMVAVSILCLIVYVHMYT
jgi:hypothetical protein